MGYSPAMGMRFEDALLSMRHRMKTAEVRLYMLARGRLAYSVTPAHTPLPPKIIILVLYNRSSAVDYYSPTDPR